VKNFISVIVKEISSGRFDKNGKERTTQAVVVIDDLKVTERYLHHSHNVCIYRFDIFSRLFTFIARIFFRGL
jgi:hypothetical protein